MIKNKYKVSSKAKYLGMGICNKCGKSGERFVKQTTYKGKLIGKKRTIIVHRVEHNQSGE